MDEELSLAVRLTPSARRDAILGWADGADGTPVLKVSVTAVPEKGKANRALIALLAKEWRIPKTSIRIARGETDRNKLLKINGLREIPL